ncbi:MAG: M20/M25/M40 family metallo-hydrolase [Deltaproteobacteria bacterium]|nr:M20/M25/M40 family metallo-hydrolase [Deltaproteobacteria bacterium]
MVSEDTLEHIAALVRLAGREEARGYELLRGLCDDVGPRFPCTAGDVAGVAWAREALASAGLVNARAEEAPAELWERGHESLTAYLPRAQRLMLTSLGGSVATPEGGLSADVVAFDSLDALDAASVDQVEGRIVYLHHVMPRLRDGTGYNAGSMARTAGPSRAARKGAVGFLVRSIGTETVRSPHTGALFYDDATAKIPAAALAIPDADQLFRAARAGRRVRADLSLGCKPLPIGMSANVLAELPGATDEIVLLGAHLDSWELGTGALDDGAGCVIAIEAARLLSALPVRPRRTIRVGLFANEELGIGGGLAYAGSRGDEAKRHVAAIEADQGDGRPWALRVPANGRETALTRSLCEALGSLGISLDAGPSRGGVDISPLRQLGVPFVDLRQDATRYFDFHHTANDVIDNVSREDLAHATVAFAITVWILANAPERYAAGV